MHGQMIRRCELRKVRASEGVKNMSYECRATAKATSRERARMGECGKQENELKVTKWSQEEKKECRGWFHVAMVVILSMLAKALVGLGTHLEPNLQMCGKRRAGSALHVT